MMMDQIRNRPDVDERRTHEHDDPDAGHQLEVRAATRWPIDDEGKPGEGKTDDRTNRFEVDESHVPVSARRPRREVDPDEARADDPEADRDQRNTGHHPAQTATRRRVRRRWVGHGDKYAADVAGPGP